MRDGEPKHVMDYILQELRALGLEVPAGTRLHTYKVWIDDFYRRHAAEGDKFVTTKTDFEQIDTVTLEAEYLRTIVAAMIAAPIDPRWVAKLRKVLEGHAFPTRDANPQARNTQFELYVAALLKNAGIAVALDEPDCTIEFEGMKIGFAAKRLSSRQQASPPGKRCIGSIVAPADTRADRD